jgi:hypothetical protein
MTQLTEKVKEILSVRFLNVSQFESFTPSKRTKVFEVCHAFESEESIYQVSVIKSKGEYIRLVICTDKNFKTEYYKF